MPNHIKLRKYFFRGLVVDTIRGWDGTGVIAVNDKNEINVAKRALCGPDFLGSRQFLQLCPQGTYYKAMIGHNRSSTVGANSDDNTHPFQHEHITLVHNGTLDRVDNGLDKTAPFFKVDSEEIAYALSKKEPKEVLSSIIGAYALVWIDSRDNTINFARNDERPLWLANTKDDKTLLFASTPDILRASLADPVSGECSLGTLNKPYLLAKGSWLKVSMEKEKKLKEQFTIKKFTIAKRPPVKTYPHHQNQNLSDFVLKRLNVEYGSTILFSVNSSVPSYDSHSHSKITGHMISNSPDFVVCDFIVSSGFVANEELRKSKNSVYQGKILSGRYDHQEKKDIVAVTNVSYVGTRAKFKNGYFDHLDTNFFFVEEEEEENLDNDTLIPVLGGWTTPANYQRLIKDGCGSCSKPLDEENPEEINWYDNESPLCADCAKVLLEEEPENLDEKTA